MELSVFSVVLVAFLFGLLFAGLWVGFALMATALVALYFFSDPSTLGLIMATTAWGESAKWTVTSLPLFIWMGEILFRTRLAEDMFAGLAPWLARIPGRLLHINVISCGIFAAVSGSCATIGKISLPELDKRGYPNNLSIGTLAASGTLGLMIPPSIIMIVYGGAADVSIAKLFIAGVVPGLLLMALFSSYIIGYALLRPGEIPAGDGTRVSFLEALIAGRRMIPITLLIVFVIGTIYAGIATPTEAAALGVFGALVLSFSFGTLTRDSFMESLKGATATSCMIAFIMTGAAFLSIAMGFAGIPAAMAKFLTALNLSPYGFLFGLTIIFIILGCFLDGVSIVLLTAAVILPSVKAFGFDLVWFGIYLVIVVEIAMITPPVGFNLFVIQNLTNKELFSIARSAVPFLFLLLIGIVLMTIFPSLVTYLPSHL
jgi:tripartite ATP-independent transporter DctM subunit